MNILEFKDTKISPDIVHEYSSELRDNLTPIVIDNGSFQCRVGWVTSIQPLLVFKNLLARPRKERSKKETSDLSQIPQLQVGNDISSIEAVRFQLKTQFDRNVVTHFEAQEHLFDYIFTHLGINSDKCVPHPIVMTEAFLNPNSSRQLMSELLFECYDVPSITYGIDALFSYHYAQSKPPENALIVSFGYHTTHIIPVLDNKTIFVNTRRINTGGFHVISFLHKILQLKYPAHATAITLSRAEELVHTVCLVALDYKEELKKWNDSDYYESKTMCMQLPFTSNISTTLTLEQQKERKKELAKRLSEINARRREERLQEDEERLQKLLEIQDVLSDAEDEESVLNEYHIRNVDDLHKSITLLNIRIDKMKKKIAAANSADEMSIEEPPIKQSKRLVFESEVALQSFIQNAKKKRQEIFNRKAARKQRKQDMAKRRTAAGQERMRIISQLARKEKGNDDFGLRDEDWDIYKTISRDGGDSDSETENEKLLELEEIIKMYDPLDGDDCSTPGESHQLHIGIERYRAPELIFKPYMMGSPEAGLTEVIEYVLSLFNDSDQLKLAGNIVLVGGLASLPGILERIQTELVSIRPFQSFSQVSVLPDPGLSAWYGARQWCRSPDFQKGVITKAMYDEYGGEYNRKHTASNYYYPTPKENDVDVDS